MNGHAYPDRPIATSHWRPLAVCLLMAALAVVAVLAVIAPTANAGKDRTLEESFTLTELGIHDSWLTRACGFEVNATVSGTFERKLVIGTGRKTAAHETSKFDGHIAWIAEESGKTYSDEIENTSRIEYPEGVDDYGLPANVTVTGTHAGVFPVGDGPPGHGKFEYEAGFLIGGPDELPFVFATSEGTWDRKSFDRATEKICAKLA
jgi:hypothetical protein